MMTWALLDSGTWVTFFVNGKNFFSVHIVLVTILFAGMTIIMVLSILDHLFFKSNLFDPQMAKSISVIVTLILLIQVAFYSFLFVHVLSEPHSMSLALQATAQEGFWKYSYAVDWTGKIDWVSSLPWSTPLYYDYASESFCLSEEKNRLVVPANIPLKLSIISENGQIDSVLLTCLRPGSYYVHCKELWGCGNSDMPMILECLSQDWFLTWLAGVFF